MDDARPDDPMVFFEWTVARSGFRRVAGVDEAGRGPLAGPIVAGAVILGEPLEGLNDSKLLTESQREFLFEALIAGPHQVGVAIIDAESIDRDGIQAANYAAMLGAAASLDEAPDFLLVDGFEIRGCVWPQKALIKGDRRSASIAAASIVAKVTRDRLMKRYDAEFPGYGFAEHKGYGTSAHLDALRRLGPCPIHRRSFEPLANKKARQQLCLGI